MTDGRRAFPGEWLGTTPYHGDTGTLRLHMDAALRVIWVMRRYNSVGRQTTIDRNAGWYDL